jgi:hypothetical protein
VGPEQAPQRVSPPARLAEQLPESLLLHRFVVPLGRGDPDLGVEGDGADGLFFEVLDTQLEEEARNGGKLENFGTLYPEVQLRHGRLLEACSWFSSLGCRLSPFHISSHGVPGGPTSSVPRSETATKIALTALLASSAAGSGCSGLWGFSSRR